MELNKENRIGQGNTAEIFKLDDNKILKLFRNGMDKRIVEREYLNCSFIQNVLDCVPKVFEMVEVEGRYGIVYQQIQGTDMLKRMLASIWRINTYAKELAHYHLNIQRPIDGQLCTVKAKLEEDINSAEILSKEKKELILQYLRQLPDGNELCHFDFHPGNIMLTKDRAYLIDWMTACVGDSCPDVVRTCVMLKYGEVPHAPWLMRKMISIFQHRIYKVYIKEYLLISGKKMEDIKRWELPVAAARLREWIPENEKQILLQLIQKECTLL